MCLSFNFEINSDVQEKQKQYKEFPYILYPVSSKFIMLYNFIMDTWKLN